MQIVMSLVGVATIFGIAVPDVDQPQARSACARWVARSRSADCIAAIVLYVPQGGRMLDKVVKGVQFVINQGKHGIEFVFGTQIRIVARLHHCVQRPARHRVFRRTHVGALLPRHHAARGRRTFGGWLHKLLGTSHAESVSAVSNIFVGHTDAPLVVRPYLRNMTQSELFAVMTGGCATIAGAVMMGYAQMGVELKYLITASFMAAPGGLMMAKILMPETEPHDERRSPRRSAEEDQPVNIFEAIGNGAMTGMNVALGVGAMLVAFVGLIYLINGLLGLFGGLIGFEDLTVQWVLGKLFAPLAFLLGVPWAEAAQAGSLIGQKLVINEFYAYVSFVEIKDTLTPYTQLVVTFALCGFSNLASIAILLGGLGAVAPARRHDIARLGLKAVIGGTLVNLLNASLAGFFFALQ